MTMEAMPLCDFCKYKIKGVRKCEVFPDEIPDEAYYNDHVIPINGDNGVVFEPAEEYRNDEYIRIRVEDFRSEFTAKRLKKEEELLSNFYKSELPLEEWADEYIRRDLIKADLHLFVQALLSIKHWVFASLTPLQSENLYTALVERMTADKWSLKDLTRTIQEAEPILDEAQAEAIARSESTLIVNKSREMQFERDPPGKYGYYWSGPSDHRTTEICSNIKTRTPAAGFDSPEDLSRVIKEEAKRYYESKGYKTQIREWLPHPNCRHTITSKMR
ncbi:hypothetical protein A3207_00975 [Candidatus Methanomassiliicoccus intestinalis]|jgi:hypothetical protein|uniref:Phage head morphogenesis domain-containing protein n=2 Tax=Candidatus Methanomassiliicoccus intestinalis TaxID=1406512 RepID=R9T6D8_METII|nr:hypothetical protein [Candidatus Methanomassiliicoccus intestinalis]AGN26285.1 hypothetical protein MMINT_09250 [Candidatus Methanomassiliicoccus intestinalis Issoire-Mx1]TQS84646.1 MAG: hypothetical protein A3207_00975 [Candidatus Methanomassiliicoccus intestinalis]